jgi:hypothetical protein
MEKNLASSEEKIQHVKALKIALAAEAGLWVQKLGLNIRVEKASLDRWWDKYCELLELLNSGAR